GPPPRPLAPEDLAGRRRGRRGWWGRLPPEAVSGVGVEGSSGSAGRWLCSVDAAPDLTRALPPIPRRPAGTAGVAGLRQCVGACGGGTRRAHRDRRGDTVGRAGQARLA